MSSKVPCSRTCATSCSRWVSVLLWSEANTASRSVARITILTFCSIISGCCCFVVVELKIGAFQPEHAGKMNFYLSAVDDRLRYADDEPSIGLILCKERNRVVVEYALRSTDRPIGVAEYRITERLPAQLLGSLPSAEELAKEIGGALHS